jgi:outer membrane receptor protein involved in Fe transport
MFIKRERLSPVALILALFTLIPASAMAQAVTAGKPYLDKPVFEVLEHFRNQGYPFAYSTNLVPESLTVLSEPVSGDPLGIVEEILKPHGLTLKLADGIYLVTRSARGPPPADSGSVLVIIRNQASKLLKAPVVVSGSPGLRAVENLGPGLRQIKNLDAGSYELEISAAGFLTTRRTVVISPGATQTLNVKLAPQLAELETLNVSASRYVLFSNSQFFVDQRAIRNLPGNGDDPLRSIHRLPGAAAGGWSAQTHFRGGEENESAIFLNGLRLLDPFHVRDFHNVFSSIDSRTISGVEAYTGGFPARYGDRMSGLMLLQSRKPEKPREYELGLSVFNTSLLTSGYNSSGKLDWLLSARRSNLGLVLDRKKHGEPDYDDVFGTLGINYTADTRITLNVLRASDRILVITEHLPEEEEKSTSDTRNRHLWVQLESSLSPELGMSAVLSGSSFKNRRHATVNDAEQLVGFVEDDRDVEILGLRADFNWYANRDHILTWGVEARKETARYRYLSEAGYDGFYLAYPGVPESLARNISLSPGGESYSAYVSDRWQAAPRLVLETGLRWDKQTWIGPAHDEQLSPRFNLLFTPDPRLDLRLTWGRYYQSQQIQQLHVEDGVEQFFPSQRADHLIAGVGLQLNPQWKFRFEAFDKSYSRLKPRFENLLDPVPLIAELEPDRVRIEPSGARARGAEFTVEYDGGDSMNGWVSYTLSRVTDRVDGISQPRNWDQRHSLQAGLAWKKGQWDFGLAARLHSGWPTTAATVERDEEGELVLLPAARNAENLRTFSNIDLRVARSWQLPRSRLTAFFEISNAQDHRNECCIDYDVEEEDDEIPVLERSVDHWLGISPAIGLLWEF